jgi:hypothetical protein
MEDSAVAENEPGSVLEEASAIVRGPRQDAYGTAKVNHDRIAAIWSVILGVPVTARQAALCMIGVKLAREAHAPKRDNLVDIAGYADVAHRCGE